MTEPSLPSHSPVLLNEVLRYLNPEDGGIYIDGTFGGGGYSQAILESADCTVLAIDRDAQAIERAQDFVKKYKDRFVIAKGCYGDMKEIFSDYLNRINGIALDIGVSSFQLDDPQRGFSFRFEGPLDMRMSQEQPLSAADVVNTFKEVDIANIIYRFGEERRSRQIAKKIVEERKKETITTTSQLAKVVRSVVPLSKDGLDPATRTFQALRIFVNDELGELEKGMEAAEELLAEKGRLVVVSFHSLEDRCVKKFLKEKSRTSAAVSRHVPLNVPISDAVFKVLTPSVVTPTQEEVSKNRRASSAKLRAAEKLGRKA
jgi:16S rRNA (cytosine1402-N4)-methyltransferase